jgi:hypothetical protein
MNDALRLPMECWKTPLGDVPLNFRGAITTYAFSKYDQIMLEDYSGSTSLEQSITAEATGLSPILYAGYVPYHLLDAAQVDDALSLLEKKGPGALLSYILENCPVADSLLVLGDQPVTTHMTEHLDAIFESQPARYLIAGPGTQVEEVLKAYAANRNISKSHVKVIDASRGESWSQPPGEKLEALIVRLFHSMKPSRIVVFEPARLPATLLALEAARHMDIPVEYIAAPSLRRTAASVAF